MKGGDAMDDQRANALQDIVELEPRSAWLHAELWPDEGSLEGDEFLRVQAQVALLASRLLAASSLASAAILAESLRLAEIAQRSLTESAQ